MIEIKINGSAVYRANEYSFTESDMGSSKISLTMFAKKDDAVNFSHEMYVEYMGEMFFLSKSKPTGNKGTTSLMYEYTLEFQSKRADLENVIVKDLTQTQSGAYISQGTVLKVYADLKMFCSILQNNLDNSFYGKWFVELNPSVPSDTWVHVEASDIYLWDLLLKTYELFGVRWRIVSSGGVMKIRIGYPSDEIQHIFKYGSESGLTKITRTEQSEQTANRIYGVGGTRNLPVNYFTDRYPNFTPDPNKISGEVNIKGLMPHSFRRSVIAGADEFIEYVQDDASVALNGAKEAPIEANEDIYPSIEGVEINGLGRIDELVYAEVPNFDNPEYKGGTKVSGVEARKSSNGVGVNVSETEEFTTNETYIVAKLNLTYKDIYDNGRFPPTSFKTKDGKDISLSGNVTLGAKVELIDVSSGSVIHTTTIGNEEANTEHSIEIRNIAIGGRYKFKLTATGSGGVSNGSRMVVWESIAKLYNISVVDGVYKPTFDIWVKDIQFDLKDDKYTALEEAKIGFKSGMLTGYEFKILAINKVREVVEDDSKSINGVNSKYRITLIKSDEEYQASGSMIPNKYVHANAEDKFVILDINMPFEYVEMAEKKQEAYLTSQLDLMLVEKPKYTIETLDSFIAKAVVVEDDGKTLQRKLRAGTKLFVLDKQLTGGDEIGQHISSITAEYKKDSVIPKYTIVTSDEVLVNGSQVQRLQAQIDAISDSQVSTASSLNARITQLDGIYARKNAPNTMYQENTFNSQMTIDTMKTNDFNQGVAVGSGLGIYKGLSGRTVLEVDDIVVRNEAHFNTVVINQLKYQGGIMVYSAANMEVSEVIPTSDGYTLKFDKKGNTVLNQFALNDIVMCHRFSAEDGTTKYFKTVVTGLGDNYITISESLKESGCTVNPEVGDVIVQFGNTQDVERQSVIVVDVTNGGSQTFYQKLGDGQNIYSTVNKNYIEIGRVHDNNSWKNMIRVFGNMYFGNRNGNSYIKYDEATDELEIRAKVSIGSSDTGYNDVEDELKKIVDNANGAIDKAKNDAINAAAQDATSKKEALMLERIVPSPDFSYDRLDYISSYTRTAKANAPAGCPLHYCAKQSTRDGVFYNMIKVEYLQEFYFDAYLNTQETAHTCGVGFQVFDENYNTITWRKAIELTSGNGWAKVSGEITIESTWRYVRLWSQIDASDNFGNLYITGLTVSDSIAAQNKANQAITELSNQLSYINTIKSNLQTQIDGVVDSWFFPYTPDIHNEPASLWTDDTKKGRHVGDTFTNTQTYVSDEQTPNAGKSWRWVYDSGAYKWTQIADSDAVKALLAASKAQDTADNKRRVFTAQPTDDSAYDVGDLWVNATLGNWNNEMLKCRTAKAKGAAFDSSHWDLATKYTDDTAVENLKVGTRNYIRGTKLPYLNTQNKDWVGWYPTLSVDENEDALVLGARNGWSSVFVDLPLNVGDEYTLIADAKIKSTDIDGGLVNIWAASDEHAWFDGVDRIVVTLNSSEYKKVVFKSKVSSAKKASLLSQVGDNSGKYCDMYIKNWRIVSGNKEVDFTYAPEDVQSEIDTAKQEAAKATQDAANAITSANAAKESVNNLDAYVKGAFKDGIVSDSEKSVIDRLNSQVDVDFTRAMNEYEVLSNNTYLVGDAKTELVSKKNTLSDKKSLLQAAIDAAIADTIVTPEEKHSVNSAFYAYSNAFKDYQTSVANANKAIQARIDSLSSEKVNSIQVGGENLLDGTKDFSGWSLSSTGNASLDGSEYNGCKAYYASTAYGRYYSSFNFVLGKTYILSAYFKTNTDTDFYCLEGIDGTERYMPIHVLASEGWIRKSITFTIDNVKHLSGNRDVYAMTNHGNGYWVSGIKLVEGNKDSDDWSPSIFDIQQDIKKSADAIQIGGRNLLLNSRDRGFTKWANGGSYYETIDASGVHTITCNTAGMGFFSEGLPDGVRKIGDEFTMSFYAKCSVARNHHIGVESGGQHDFSITTEWKKYVYTFKQLTEITYSALTFYSGWNAGDVLYIHSFKIERGNKDTEWTPAPEDVATNIADAKSAGTNAQSAIDKMNNDAVFDIVEKQTTRTQWELISGVADVTTSVDSYTSGSFAKAKATNSTISYFTTLRDKVEALRSLLSQYTLYVNSNYEIAFSRTTLAGKFKDYYDALDAFYDAVSKGYVDDVKIGGENLLLNSLLNVSDGAVTGGAPRLATLSVTQDLIQGKQYCFSIRARAQAVGGRIFLTLTSTQQTWGFRYTMDVISTDTEFHTYYGVVTAPYTHVKNDSAQIGLFHEGGDSVVVESVMIEEGNKPSLTWKPSVKDIEKKIDDIEVGGVNTFNHPKQDVYVYNVDGYNPNHEQTPYGFYAVGKQSVPDSHVRLSRVIDGNGWWTVSFEIAGTQSSQLNIAIDICDRGHESWIIAGDNQFHRVVHSVYVDNYNPETYHFVDFSGFWWMYYLVRNIKVEKGNKATAFSECPDILKAKVTANETVTNAIKNNLTTVDGGLILTTLMKMLNNGAESAGIAAKTDTNNVAIWGGGTLEQAINRASNFGVTHDGDVWLRGVIEALTGKIGNLNIDGNKLYSDSMTFVESAVDSLDSLLNPTSSYIPKQDSWRSSTSTGSPIFTAEAYTQQIVVSVDSKLQFGVRIEPNGSAVDNYSFEIRNASGAVIYKESGRGIFLKTFDMPIPAGTYSLHAEANSAVDIGSPIRTVTASIYGTSFEDEHIWAKGYSYKTKIGNDGFYSFWDALKYIYYSSSQGLKVRGAADVPALGGGTSYLNGGVVYKWGRVSAASRSGNTTTVTHSAGSTNEYSVILTAYGNNLPYISDKGNNTLSIYCAGSFDFVIIRTK